MKKRREKATEDYEKDSAVSSVIAGVVCIIIALWILTLNITWVSFAIALLLIGLGAFFILRKRSEKRLEEALKDENSPQSVSYRKGLEKKIQRAAQKAHAHKGFKGELYYRTVKIAAFVFVLTLFFLFVMLMESTLMYVVLTAAAAIGALIFFIYSLTGKDYKRALAAFKAVGGSKEEAEREFAEGALFRCGGDAVCVGRDCIFGCMGLKTEVIPMKIVVWMFMNQKLQYNYYNGVYTGKTKQFFINFCTSGGRIFTYSCSEEGGILIIDEVHHNDTGVLAGWSDELWELYAKEPAGFLEAAVGAVMPSPYELAGKNDTRK